MDNMISRYYDYVRRKDSSTIMPGSVSDDLDIDSIFSIVDNTCSYIGKQYLYYILQQNVRSNIWKFEDVINKFKTNQTWRKAMKDILTKMNSREFGYICSLFVSPIHAMSHRTIRIIGFIRFFPFLLVTLFASTHQLLWLCLLVIALLFHLCLHYKNKKNIYSYYHAIPQMVCLLKQAELLVKEEDLNVVNEKHLKCDKLRELRKKMVIFNIGIKLDSDFSILIYTVAELLNIFFLEEYYAVNKSLIYLCRRKQLLEDTFLFVGLFDVLYSVACLREKLPYYSIPFHISSNRYAIMEDIYHPMLKNAVANSIHVHGKSVLVVGSNMCGKTCFIRTVGVNLVVSKALNTSFSRKFSINLNTRLFSSIQHTDNLKAGNSLFFQEVIDIKKMLDESLKGECLYLIDEPFSGTNNMERIAICTSVLTNLAKNGNIVFVTTHDMELQTFLISNYNCYHFSEQISDGRIKFDYKLHKGKSSERNATKILSLCDYPKDVVQYANEIVTHLSH